MVHTTPDASVHPSEVLGHIVGWARVPPLLAWKHPGLPKGWVPVLNAPPENPTRRPLPGWVFLFDDGKIREIDRRFLEVVTSADRPRSR